MVVQKVLGKKKELLGSRIADALVVEWYETSKKILHKRTASGMEIILKRINEPVPLQQDDVVYADAERLVFIEINPCTVIRIQPGTMYAMAQVVYEIGNKHLPLYYEDDCLLVPYEPPLFRVLTAAGFQPVKEERKLLHPLKTTVAPHGHNSGSGSLFSRIMQLTNNG